MERLDLVVNVSVTPDIARRIAQVAYDWPENVDRIFEEAINKIATQVGPPALPEVTFKRALIKVDTADERYALGVALEPDEVDTQGDTQTAATIRKAAFEFMEAYRQSSRAGNLGLMHKQIVNGDLSILESYIQKGDGEVEGQPVKDGTWLVGLRIKSDQLWADVKKGKLTGLSIGGSAYARPAR